MQLNKTLLALSLGLVLTACQPTNTAHKANKVLICSMNNEITIESDKAALIRSSSANSWDMYNSNRNSIGTYQQRPGELCQVKTVTPD